MNDPILMAMWKNSTDPRKRRVAQDYEFFRQLKSNNFFKQTNNMTKTYTIKLQKGKIFADNANESLNISDEVELSESEIRNLLKENPELLSEPKPERKRKYFVPKANEVYYVIHTEGKIFNSMRNSFDDDDSYIDKDRFSVGNCFATEQDAQDELNRRQSLVRIWNDYDDKHSWDIDWEDSSQMKHMIMYSHEIKDFKEDRFTTWQHNTELPYFKSAEDRNQFVESNHDDLLTIFNIKK